MEKVWPWVAQMGYGRGGWYGWFPLNRQDTAATQILPQFQQPRVGHVLLDGPDCDETTGAWAVRAVQPPTTLVLYSLRDPFSGRELDPAVKPRRYIDTGWAFHLDAAGPRATRLLARTRVALAPCWLMLAAKVMGTTSLLFRTLATLEGTLRTLCPGYPLIASAEDFAADLVRERTVPATWQQAAQDELTGALPLLRRAPAT